MASTTNIKTNWSERRRKHRNLSCFHRLSTNSGICSNGWPIRMLKFLSYFCMGSYRCVLRKTISSECVGFIILLSQWAKSPKKQSVGVYFWLFFGDFSHWVKRWPRRQQEFSIFAHNFEQYAKISWEFVDSFSYSERYFLFNFIGIFWLSQ